MAVAYSKASISLALPIDLIMKIDVEATRKGMSRSAVVAELLAGVLDPTEKTDTPDA